MAVLGIIKAFWLGSQIDIKPGGTVKLGGLVNTPVVFGEQVEPARKMEASEVSVKAVVKDGLVVTDTFNVKQRGELQVQCDTGQTFVWDSAFINDAITITSGDNSEVDVKWACGTPLETTQS
jgi:hypothetical protein